MIRRRDVNVFAVACLTMVTCCAVLPAKAGQEASTKKHDNAEARQYLGQAVTRKSIAATRAKAGDVPGALATAAPDADAYSQTEMLIGATKGILESLKPAVKP